MTSAEGPPSNEPRRLNERSFRRRTIAGNIHEQTDKRRRILDAAVQVFAARGFYNARVSDIAKAAGVADGTIYLYFKNKDDLLISLFEDRMEGIIEAFRSELGDYPQASGRLRRFIDLHLHMVADQPTLAEVLTVELRQSAKFMREYKAPKFAEYLDLIEEVVRFGQETGEFRDDVDPVILKRVLFGALDEVSLHWVSSRRKPYDLDRAAAELWNICAHGVLHAERREP